MNLMRGLSAKRLSDIASKFLFSTQIKHRFKFVHGSHMIPHPEKAYKGGEDALFVSDNLIVVADGVGGWADQGVDPGLYSKKLCEIIGQKIKKNSSLYMDNPKQLLSEAVKENKQIGSTTVCMLSLNQKTGKLIAYYLGDSVYGFFSKTSIEIAQDQQKSFNFPFQIGSVGDDPSEGVLHEHQPSDYEGKILVAATDGVWDNYDVQKIQKDIEEPEKVDKVNISNIAKKIAEGSFKHSLLQNYESPFYKKALMHRLRTYKSGKPDDITVIVSKIIKQQIA